MMTTNNMAVSVWPNQMSASGTQQTLGSVWKPSASEPTVSSMSCDLLAMRPTGSPMATPIRYPTRSRRTVTTVASSRLPSSVELQR
jgi:hypothetical protein